MSASKRIAFAVTVSWLGRAISIFSGLFLTPILFRLMGKEELGVWYLLGNSQSFLGLLGLGIIPTLTRYIAFARAKDGNDLNAEMSREVKQEVGDWVVTGQTILQWLAVVIFFVAWLSGYGVINQLNLKDISSLTVIAAWTIMCVGYAISVWVSYLNCWLAGIGYVGWDGVIGTVLSLLTIIASIIAVQMHGGIVALAVITLLNALLGRFIYLLFIRWREPDLLAISGKWRWDYAKKMIQPSILWWLTDLGAFLILRTDAYFIGLMRGAAEIPAYQATYSLLSTPYQLAVAFASASPVFISQAWQAQDLKTIHKLTLRNAKIGLSIMASGVGFVLIFGQEFFELWIGKGNFVGYGVIAVFCIMLTLEAQHVILVISSRATDDEKYAPIALTAGFLNVVFTSLLIKPYGLLGVALGTMFAQILTNNWYAVYRPMVRLKLSFKLYFQEVIVLWFTVLSSSLIMSWLVKYLLTRLETSSWVLIGAGLITCGLIFLISLWINVLDIHHRRSIQFKLAEVFNR
jgi:O-antigen/teichoic acid export membrane protein